MPPALDVRATVRLVESTSPEARSGCANWLAVVEGQGSTWSETSEIPPLEVEGSGRAGLRRPAATLDCGNSGTTMRLGLGALAPCAVEAVLDGDQSLRGRPMERVAEPLRAMGAGIETTGGCPPVTLRGARLRGLEWRMTLPSAQVKSAILIAALGAEGPTTVEEPSATRDHTERMLHALGAPIEMGEHSTTVRPFQHEGFSGTLPGDPSSAAFLVAAAALTGGALEVPSVGLNPSRLHYVDALRRFGVTVEAAEEGRSVGEPFGRLIAGPAGETRGSATFSAEDLPLLIDEVPLLAVVAAFGVGETRFEGAGELRVKESDRLAGTADGIRELGGDAEVQGDALVVAGGGLRGGTASARGDHRLAMAFAVGALAASGPSQVDGIEWADVSFPGFVWTLRRLGAQVEVEG